MTHPHAAADSIETLADLLGQLGGCLQPGCGFVLCQVRLLKRMFSTCTSATACYVS